MNENIISNSLNSGTTDLSDSHSNISSSSSSSSVSSCTEQEDNTRSKKKHKKNPLLVPSYLHVAMTVFHLGISYSILQRKSDGLFSASHLCETFNKEWRRFAEQLSTKEYIEDLCGQGIQKPV